MSAGYNAMELMICCAARLLEDGRTAAVGTGVPCAAAMLAQRTHAPQLVILFEAGGVAPQLPTMPISVGDSRRFTAPSMATSMADIMETCQRGLIDYTFLGGAQIDPYGNLNSTRIGGDYARPKVRLPGSGGANDLASFCWRIFVVTNHDRRRFVEKLDFLTTPGYLTGPGRAKKRVCRRGPALIASSPIWPSWVMTTRPGVCSCTACIRASRLIESAPPPASSWVCANHSPSPNRPLPRNCASSAKRSIPTVT